MKWVGLLLLWILGINSRAQSSDIIYVPDDNTLIVTYKTEIVGLYIGGKYITSYPAPYLYTTPSAFVNRFGAGISLFKDVSVLVGAQVPMYTTSWIGIQYKPEVWVKSRVVGTIIQKKLRYDLNTLLQISKTPYYGIGVCIRKG
jgi:hypothetical protein